LKHSLNLESRDGKTYENPDNETGKIVDHEQKTELASSNHELHEISGPNMARELGSGQRAAISMGKFPGTFHLLLKGQPRIETEHLLMIHRKALTLEKSVDPPVTVGRKLVSQFEDALGNRVAGRMGIQEAIQRSARQRKSATDTRNRNPELLQKQHDIPQRLFFLMKSRKAAFSSSFSAKILLRESFSDSKIASLLACSEEKPE